jgi:Tol biopolymer transport system component
VAAARLDNGNWDIWTLDLADGPSRRLAFTAAAERFPVWSPDGSEIAFRVGNDIAVKAADGSQTERVVVEGLKHAPGTQIAWAPAGNLLLFQRLTDNQWNLWSAAPTPGSTPGRLVENAAQPSISPDGKYLAYTSTEGGRVEVFVRSYPDGDKKWIVSASTGNGPKWSRKGDELFYREFRSMMAARIDPKPAFRILKTERLFDGGTKVLTSEGYDVMPDGQRFVAVESVDEETRSIVVVENWMENFRAGLCR